MTSRSEDRREQDELELQFEEIKDLDVDEHVQDELLGGQSYGGSQPAPTK